MQQKKFSMRLLTVIFRIVSVLSCIKSLIIVNVHKKVRFVIEFFFLKGRDTTRSISSGSKQALSG
jgi:hypothetical protein